MRIDKSSCHLKWIQEYKRITQERKAQTQKDLGLVWRNNTTGKEKITRRLEKRALTLKRRRQKCN